MYLLSINTFTYLFMSFFKLYIIFFLFFKYFSNIFNSFQILMLFIFDMKTKFLPTFLKVLISLN